MYFGILDSGTTNSRLYILNHNFMIVHKNEKKIGVRDTSISGSRETLIKGLVSLISETLESMNSSLFDIRFIIASGMITSEIGLLEVPHLVAPVGIEDLAQNIKVVHNKNIFPLDIPILFIRGIKNRAPKRISTECLRDLDFMRGEETQAVGLLKMYPDLPLPITMVILSSHTKYISIDEEKQIRGGITNLSGQIFEAIREQTNIGKSILCEKIVTNNHKPYFNQEIVDIAYSITNQVGFLRAILMPRFMDVLMHTTAKSRCLFLNSAIATEDLKVIKDFDRLNFPSIIKSTLVIIGYQNRGDLFHYLFNKHYKFKGHIQKIYKKEEIEQISIDGAVSIIQKSGIIEKLGVKK